MPYFTYILESQKNGRFYIGHAKDPPKRLEQHNAGYNPSTKGGRLWELVYKESFNTKAEAMKREHEIKRKKSHSWIQWLIDNK